MTVPRGTPRRSVETDAYARVFEILRSLDRRISTLERGSRVVPPEAEREADPTSLDAQLDSITYRLDGLSSPTT
jgi:hypothetical protein